MIRAAFYTFGLVFVCSVNVWGEEADAYAGLKHLKESLAVPKQFGSVHDFSPVTYLQMFTDDDIKRFTKADGSLGQKQKASLEKLFIEAHRAAVKKYGQSYPLPSDAPLVKLLASAHPEITKLAKEPDGSIYMVEIIGILLKIKKQ